jgi:5-formyltetrahydrofolate cyclo-ligase
LGNFAVNAAAFMTLSPELAQWRKTQRSALLERRCAASAADHARWSAAIEAQLRQAFALNAPWVVGFCWPYQAEFDARPFATWLHARGVQTALPVVVGKGQPLEFRAWWPGVAMVPGVYDIPVPQDTEALVPDVLLVPPVGIGVAGDRLGYGGGFFDRTLAAIAPPPITIATAFELSRLPTTYPQAHDVLMDLVVTELGVQGLGDGVLQQLDLAQATTRFQALAQARGLPRQQGTGR